MKIGVSMFVTGTSIDVAVLAKKAEELGFESLWLPKHPTIPVHITPLAGQSGWRNAHLLLSDR